MAANLSARLLNLFTTPKLPEGLELANPQSAVASLFALFAPTNPKSAFRNPQSPPPPAGSVTFDF
jgi:hypothetical protein